MFLCKGIAIPLLAWTDPEGSGRFKSPRFQDNRHSWYSFLLEVDSTPVFLCKILINFYFPSMTISSKWSFSFPTQISYALFVSSCVPPVFLPSHQHVTCAEYKVGISFISFFQNFSALFVKPRFTLLKRFWPKFCSAFPNDSYQYHSSYSKLQICLALYTDMPSFSVTYIRFKLSLFFRFCVVFRFVLLLYI
jgi:hypothetical protein